MNELQRRDEDVFWHPCSHAPDLREFPPFEVLRAEGARLHLREEGRERSVLDLIASWWCKSLGHGHPRLKTAVRAQMDRFEHVIAANTTHELLVSVCERVLAAANGHAPSAWGPRAPKGRLPGKYGKVFLADNGSTAVEIAVKMALQAQAQRGERQRTAFVALENGYHGETLATLSLGDCGLYGAPYEPLFFPVEKLGPLPYRDGPADPRWLDAEEAVENVTRKLAPRAETLAAIVYEPVLQAAGGMRLISPRFFEKLGAWAHAHGIFLVADEIAAGWGRLGAMLATHLVSPAPAPKEAWPDFVALSKGLTAGFSPLSAVLTSDEIAALFDAPFNAGRSFLHSNTYTGHALGVAAAGATLDAFVEEDVLAQVHERGRQLGERLLRESARRPFVLRCRQLGLVGAVDLATPAGKPLDPAARTGRKIQREAFRRGAFLRPLGDTLYLFPPLNTTASELDEMLDLFFGSIDAVLAS